MPFTRVDRNLMVRVAQRLREEAEVLRRCNEPWTAEATSKRAKALFDRLIRDSGDLDALRRRMESEHPEMLKLLPVVEQPSGGSSG